MRAVIILLSVISIAGCASPGEQERSDLTASMVMTSNQEIATLRQTLGDRAENAEWAVRSYDVRGEFKGWAVTEKAVPLPASRLCRVSSYFVDPATTNDISLSRRDTYIVQSVAPDSLSTPTGCAALDPVLEPFMVGEGVDPAAAVDRFLISQAHARNKRWTGRNILCDGEVCTDPRRAFLGLSAVRIQSIAVQKNTPHPGLWITFYREEPPAGFTSDPPSQIYVVLPDAEDNAIRIARLTPVGG